jgi:DNA-binding MurR/RpiR family transcriptional regulator
MPNSTAPLSFVSRIRGAMPGLSTAERRLAEVMLDFPGDIAGYSASELARLANVSNATVTRFVRRLGYAGYDAARRSVRDEHGAGSPLFLARADSAANPGSLAAHAEQAIANVQSTFHRLAEAEIDAIAERVVAARKVWIAGFRASHGFAAYLRWQIYQVIEGATLVPGPGETLAETVAGMSGDDVAIVFALRRRVAVQPELLRQILKAGTDVVLITNGQGAGDLPATWTLRCDSQAPGPLDNHVAVMALLHVLATRIIERSGAQGRRRLAQIQHLHDALSEL